MLTDTITKDQLTLYICLGVTVLVLLILGAILIVTILKKKKIKDSENKVNQQIDTSTDSLVLALGGKDNIKKIEAVGSRVKVAVIDFTKVNQEEVKTLHSSVLFMGEQVYFVIGSLSQQFATKLIEKSK